ncbi:hypothetical protein PIB30_101304 [Stylosanthes scabra]|uniref:Putative plant transposon protein domain-containing protein n=1 Tax=Stylosanthes scabra TaxID=79078 RepID=A0ABU6RXJ9_9FABA|nr:hypothetical protein [Stylosanthes scabra]
MFCRWPEKEKVLQGNPQQELAVHLPAANLHKRQQDMRLLPKRRGVNWLLSGRRGWDFMYDPTIDINMMLVREFYANRNEKNQEEVYMRGRRIPCHLRDIEGVLHIPRLEGKSEHHQMGERYDNNELDMNEVMQVIGREGATWPAIPGRLDKNLLNKDAWMWMKLVVSNIIPTRHETTLGMSVSLPGITVATMNEDPVKTKKQLLPFPMFITKWAAANEVPTYPGDKIFKWKTDSKVEWNPAPPAPAPAPAPVPPPAARTRAPAPSRGSSSRQSRDDLMRALRRNERIMPRHEQLMLMLHPDLDISQLQQISSPEVSEQQQQAASDSDDGDGSDEDGSDEESSEE